ncbi:MAG: hypothetical protein LM577_03085 [Thermoproteaceae archaeon]|jgi:hypothetical protein|nr:hypothetical protein [Thermoproteaceae archaeon]
MTRGRAVVLVIVLSCAALIAAASLALMAAGRPAQAKLHLVSAHLGPSGNFSEALRELKDVSLWASWAGRVSIAAESGRLAALRRLSLPCGERRVYHFNGTAREIGCARLLQEGGRYVLIYRHGGRELRFTGESVEDVLWQALQSGEVDEYTKVVLSGALVDYLYDIPLAYSAWAIPFCNGTYYGPPGPRVAVSNTVRYFLHPQNRTVRVVELPKYVELPLKPLGPSWFGHYVVDACALGGVRGTDIVAIVTRDKLGAALGILQRYTRLIHVEPIG